MNTYNKINVVNFMDFIIILNNILIYYRIKNLQINKIENQYPEINKQMNKYQI